MSAATEPTSALVERLRSRHAALCEEINEGSDDPGFRRNEAIRARDSVWAELVEQGAVESEEDEP